MALWVTHLTLTCKVLGSNLGPEIRKLAVDCQYLMIFSEKLNQLASQWLSDKQVWYLIIGCHLFVVSTMTTGNAERLSQYGPGC